MEMAGLDILVQFYEQVDILLLIFVRVIAFLSVLPAVSHRHMMVTVRVFFALSISVALFMSGVVTSVTYVDTPAGYVFLILQEFLVGTIMAFVVFSVYNLVYFTGQIIDFQIGLAMVNVLDPMTQIQVPIVGNLLYFVMIALLVASGGLHLLFGAFFHSYAVLPIGMGVVLGNQGIAWYMTLLLVDSIILAVRISMPVLGAMMIINAALGIMVKTVPQMNIFVVGLPIKLLVGLILLYLVMTPAAATIHRHVFELAYNAMSEVMWGMRP